MNPPHYQDATVTLHAGDCLDVLRELPDASVDAVVTDPPYGLGFMGREWDDLPPGEPFARECLRVLKPGGHLLAFGGTRTFHRLACAVEDAGFEIRDSIAWLYGSGFPKSLDVSKAIDKAAGAEREVVGQRNRAFRTQNRYSDPHAESMFLGDTGVFTTVTAPATDAARTWQGWGTALKPAFEPIVVARKPLAGTVAANVLTHGTGALNVDACRIGEGGQLKWSQPRDMGYHGGSDSGGEATQNPAGRWPANVALDETQAAALDEQSGESVSNVRISEDRDEPGDTFSLGRSGTTPRGTSDSGGASRFFYTAKAASDERVRVNGVAHPTVKPLSLMRWLVRLVTPPGGTVLEPFAGSGTTVEACILEDFRCVAIEREADYLPLIVQRINRRRDPVAAVKGAATEGDDLGLFDLLDEESA